VEIIEDAPVVEGEDVGVSRRIVEAFLTQDDGFRLRPNSMPRFGLAALRDWQSRLQAKRFFFCLRFFFFSSLCHMLPSSQIRFADCSDRSLGHCSNTTLSGSSPSSSTNCCQFWSISSNTRAAGHCSSEGEISSFVGVARVGAWKSGCCWCCDDAVCLGRTRACLSAAAWPL
jgi:hypothetical protein